MNMVIAILFVAALGVCSATLERRAPFSCGSTGYLTQDNGIIDSHTGYATGVDYGDRMNCNWKIKAPPGMYIEIKAKSFSLESHNQCTYDYLEIFDGDNIRAHKIGKFCGTTIGNYTSSQNIMTLHFKTDGSNVKPGFRLQYQFTNVSAPPICGHAGYLTTDHGIIDSHLGYASGQPYDNNLDCKWKVKAPAGMKILVTAKTFEVESRSQCTHDYLELLDGDGLSAPSLDKFCGTAMTPTMSTQNILTLHFVTDNYYLRYKGFRLHYNFTTHYERFCPTGEFKCRNNNCCESRWKCDGDDDCGDDSDETGCPRATCAGDKFKCDNGGCVTWDWLCDGNDDCGDASDENSTTCRMSPIPTNSPGCGQLNTTGVNGTISSPNFPGHYPSNDRCLWKVQGPPGTLRISISFDTNKYGMESASLCKFDYVKVYSARHSTTHGPYCGSTAPTKFVMQGDHAFIKFKSDGSNEAIGFKIYWKALST